MNIAYFIWARDQKRADKIAKWTLISAISAKQKKYSINIFLSDAEKFKILIEYLTIKNCKIYYVKRSQDARFINKVIFFRKAIEQLSSFLFVDCDTFLIKKPPKKITNKTLCFGRYKSHRLMPARTNKFLLSFGINKKIRHISSRFFWVNQKKCFSFWKSYKNEIDKILKVYKEKFDCPYSRNKKTPIADEQCFTLALLKMRTNPANYNISKFNTTKTFLLHGTRECRRNNNYIKLLKKMKKNEKVGYLF